jgi:hypothetical protein
MVLLLVGFAVVFGVPSYCVVVEFWLRLGPLSVCITSLISTCRENEEKDSCSRAAASLSRPGRSQVVDGGSLIVLLLEF